MATSPLQPFEYHLEAIHEARAAYQWYAERSQRAADGFIDELDRAEELVRGHPQIAGGYYHGTRCWKLRRYPFGLVYIERDDTVFCVAVAHLKRKPGYWKDRII